MVETGTGKTLRRLVAAIAPMTALLLDGGALAQEIKLTRSAASGVELLLVDERSWDANCKPLATAVTITTQPNNGRVTVVQGVSVVAASTSSGSAAHCAGKSVTGNQILYQSNPGFRGTDTLAYKVRSGSGKSASTLVTIHVQ